MFERFNPDARALIVRCQEQARDLGHNYIGTEHLLLGLLGEPAGTVAADVLRDAGVRHADVRQMVLDIIGPGEGASAGHIPFTPRSKKVLELSLREALKLRHKYIGPEHVLLGLVRDGEGVATLVMVKLGATLPDLRSAVLERAPAQGRRRPGFGPARIMAPSAGLTAGAVRASDLAVRRAEGGPVGSQHYLLGLLDEQEGLAARALNALGVTRETIEAKLAELGPEGTTDEPAERAGTRSTRVEVQGNEISVRIIETDLADRLREHVEAGRSGDELPGAEQLWKSLRKALQEMTARLEVSHRPAWAPPDFGKPGAAFFAVVSEAGGVSCRLWTASGVDQEKVRAWLADWFATDAPPSSAKKMAWLHVAVGRLGDITPGAGDPDGFTLSGYSCGPGAPKLAARPVPMEELVAAAVANLTTGGPGLATPR